MRNETLQLKAASDILIEPRTRERWECGDLWCFVSSIVIA